MDKLKGLKSRIITKCSPPPTQQVNNTSLIQLIDGNGNFNVKGLNDFSKMVMLSNCGLSYAVVSIIGPQSSGKSTLVNHLFGTSFKEMEAIKGRSQTTKGIWLSKAADIEPCTVVIDVEGSDGMERGEDGVLFEKQSALFALAVSDVVLVNMWCHEVGRENGGSRPLLKIVFEKILCLKSPRKITLLFILRDDTGMTPLACLEATLMTSVQEIYDSVPKQEAYATAPLDLFFNVQVISLPIFHLQHKEFKEQVEDLKTVFVCSTAAEGLIGVQEDKVPSSEIAFSLPKIWKTIKENKDLDLPAHKVMVATVRCDEIIKESLLKFSADQDWRHLERSLKSGPVSEFGKTINLIINTNLTEFDGKVVHFDEAVRIFKRRNLLDKILQDVKHANDSMLEHLYTKAVDAYKEKFGKANIASDQYLADVQDCYVYSVSIFENGTKEMENEYITWDTSKLFDRLQREINMFTRLAQLQASAAEAKAEKEKALAEAAASRAREAKTLADAKAAAETLAAAKDEAAKALAESNAAALEAARQAAADIKAAAAERASAEIQANAAKASAELAAANLRAAAAERASAVAHANELKAAAQQAAADIRAAAAERASAEERVAAAERASAVAQANELKAAAQQVAADKRAAAAERASAEVLANAAKVSVEQAAADKRAAAAERASAVAEANELKAAAQQAAADIRAAAAARASAAAQEAAERAEEEEIRRNRTLTGWIKSKFNEGYKSVLNWLME